MVYKKESLIKLLELIENISQHPENTWFKNELSLRFGSSANFKDFPTFLKFLKKNYRLKAKEFYKDLDNNLLKKELIKDHVEMQWYHTSHNVDRFLLFVFYQLENLVNYYCIEHNAIQKVKRNPGNYNFQFSDKFKVDCIEYFRKAKSIERVNSIWAKLTFWIIESGSGQWYNKTINSNIWDLINNRNQISHRNSQASNNSNIDATISDILKKDFSFLGVYLRILKKIRDTIIDQKELKKAPKNSGKTTFGDLDALQQLKNKLSNEN